MIRNITRFLHNATFKEKYDNLLVNYLNKIKIDDLKKSLALRKENIEIDHLCSLLQSVHIGNNNEIYQIFNMLNNLPNLISPSTPIGKEKDSIITKLVKNKIENKFTKNAQIIGTNLSQLRINDVTNGAESRAYYLNGQFAILERALIRYTLDILIENGFQLISVPDIINKNIVQKSGFKIDPFKNQIYNVVTNPNQLLSMFQQSELNSYPNECLAGTSEMALATYLSNSVLKKEKFPIKLCALSRCYRREVSGLESHLYRVHQFNKVEMFCATSQSESEKMLDYIVDIQTKIVEPLGLEYRILDMASEELGNPAFKKYDIEVWMPGDRIYGEISSASNCTDYQARTMNIFYENENCNLNFAHTLNGTGCAIPRLLKSILETHHTEEGHVVVPEVLRKYMNNICKITRQYPPFKANWIQKI